MSFDSFVTAGPIAPPFLPDAVVFDLDGVLVDSEQLWAQVEEDVVVELGFAWDPSVRAELLGTGPLEAAAILAEHLGGGVTADEVARATLAKSEEVFAGGVPINDGALELMTALEGIVPMAVATNSRRVLAQHALIGNELDRLLDAVVTVDDVQAAKPAPDPYLLACERIGARPRRSVGIDDSLPGIASAKAAGMWVIGCVPPGQTNAQADRVVRSLREIDAAALLGSRVEFAKERVARQHP